MSTDSAADVPDEVLRSALEFAVGIAAVGARLRPPLAFPPELKRLLRFQKLPKAALSQVRAAVEGDDDFRRRLASVATTELLDEAGVLWLTRPDGWQQAISAGIPQEVVDDQASLRREERRRIAAQESATRARAELLHLSAELDRERAANASLGSQAERLRADLDELRVRLRESQHAEHESAQALARARSELAAVAQHTEDGTAAPEPSQIAMDIDLVRKLISGAASASADISRLLNDALTAVDPVEDPPPEPARAPRGGVRRRTPLRLRGGVVAGTPEAAEFLLRTKGATTFVDGYNVAKLGWPTLSLEDQRKQCLAAVENLAKRWNIAMTVVFDGAEVEGAHAATRRRVRAVYSPSGVSADDVVRAEVAATDPGIPVVVVTNDRAIITDVAAAGANTVSSDSFLTLVRR